MQSGVKEAPIAPTWWYSCAVACRVETADLVQCCPQALSKSQVPSRSSTMRHHIRSLLFFLAPLLVVCGVLCLSLGSNVGRVEWRTRRKASRSHHRSLPWRFFEPSEKDAARGRCQCRSWIRTQRQGANPLKVQALSALC